MSLRGLFNNFSLAVLVSASALSCKQEEEKKQAELHVHDRKRITITHVDGLIETRMGGSVSWRNNNPGNLVYGEMAKKMGAIGGNGRWAVFPDYEAGSAASAALLKSASYIDLTIDEAIARRTPPNENDTKHVQKQIRFLGKFRGSEKIRHLTEQQLMTLISAIQRTEGWKPGAVVTNAEAQVSNRPKSVFSRI